jgi:hypothetical protein
MEYLSHRGIPYTARNIREDAAALRDLIEAGFSSTPVIRIGDAMLAGFDPEELEKSLAQA